MKAIKIANDWLDFKMNSLQLVPGDPDCDACVLARQFMVALDQLAESDGLLAAHHTLINPAGSGSALAAAVRRHEQRSVGLMLR